MRMKKWVVMILTLAIVCLAGCGSGESASGVPGASGAAPVVSAGSIVSFGRYEQDNNRVNGPEPIEWLVLDVQGNRALLLSRYILDAKPYHTDRVDITWEQCALRAWLNTDFISTAFSETEQSAILMTHVDNSEAQREGSKSESIITFMDSTTNGNDTEDRVFLLSYYEAFKKYFSSYEARRCAATDYAIANGVSLSGYSSWTKDKGYEADGRDAGEWWLRTNGDRQHTAHSVLPEGKLFGRGVEGNTFLEAPGVRPALWINLGAEAFTGNGTESAGPAPEPAGDENGDPVTGDSRPGESVTEPEPAETAPPAPIEDESRPAEPTPEPEPAETAPPASIEDESRPAEPTPEPEPAETAPSAPMEDESRPAEPTPEPQPAETAPPAPMEDESRPEEPTPEPKPAETAPPAPMEDESRPAEASSNVSIHVGSMMTYGTYEQDNDPQNGAEPIEWIVLDIRDGKALLLSRYALECAPYNDSRAEVTWETCTLRKWLNTSFLNGAFSQAERSAILVTDVDNSIEQGIDYEGVTGSNNTQDWVFLLSYHETEIYFDSREARACTPTAYAVARGAAKSSGRGALNGVLLTVWWLRSPGGFPCSAVYQFYDGGRESDYVDYDSWAVRPAMWVSLE